MSMRSANQATPFPLPGDDRPQGSKRNHAGGVRLAPDAVAGFDRLLHEICPQARHVDADFIATLARWLQDLPDEQARAVLDLRLDRIAQLRAILASHGCTVQGVPTHGCLHLKSAVTALDDDTVLLQPAWVGREPFADYRIVEVDPDEEHAANVLRLGARVVSPACFPRTHARIRAAGVGVVAVDVSELQKAEGAVTCCSLVFRAD